MRISKLLTVALGATFLTTFACALTSAEARSLKWARGADALTLDPHGQNEGPTIAFNNQVYETLIARDNAHKLVPGLAVSWRLRRPDHLGVQAAPGREIPRRRGLHRRRRGVLLSARARADLRLQGLSRLREGDREGRRPHGAAQDQRPEPAGGRQPHLRLHHEQEVGGGEQRHQAAGLQEPGREFRGAQRQRHRPVRARLARAGREDRGEAQRGLLGPRRSPARGHRAGAHHRSSRTRPASPRCSPAKSTSCRTCRCRTSSG